MKTYLFRKILVWGVSIFSCISSLKANDGHAPLFVSLGSHCHTAHILRTCELRKEAFPFDWIVSMDLDGIIALLEDDFTHFLDPKVLMVHGVIGDVPLLNTYYHLEFLHEGNWKRREYGPTMEKFQSKYARRIERFRHLKEYPGKVYFIRESYPYAPDENQRIYKYEENREISEQHAQDLYHALKLYFTDLDFTLIIMNRSDQGSVEEERRLTDNLIMARMNQSLEASEQKVVFNLFFNKLLQKDSL